ncbi:MAG: DUF2244 domain-containing protein [Pseudomonadota bacterium]
MSGTPSAPGIFEVELWPHNSMTPEGFVAMIGGSFAMLCIPFVGLLGTAALWGILPFGLGVLALLWFGLKRSLKDRDIHERLTVTPDNAMLVRRDPDGATRDWACNPYWVRVEMHDRVGSVKDYLTLEGGERRVEIGAFLTPEERRLLRQRILGVLGAVKAP